MDPHSEKLIEEYLDAYRAANPTKEPPSISYSNGWFRFKHGGNYRRGTLAGMRDRMRERIDNSA